MFALVVRAVTPDHISNLPVEVEFLIREFGKMFYEDLQDKLPPIRDIQHIIDLVLGATLSNLPYYRMNPTKHAELK